MDEACGGGAGSAFVVYLRLAAVSIGQLYREPLTNLGLNPLLIWPLVDRTITPLSGAPWLSVGPDGSSSWSRPGGERRRWTKQRIGLLAAVAFGCIIINQAWTNQVTRP